MSAPRTRYAVRFAVDRSWRSSGRGPRANSDGARPPPQGPTYTLPGMRRGPLRPPVTPSARAPQCPDHEERLKQQPHCSGEVGIKAEGISTGDKLRDIARKDHHEERRDDPANRCSLGWKQHQRQCQRYLHYARNRDHGFWGWHPRRYLRQKLTRIAEVPHASEQQPRGQRPARRASNQLRARAGATPGGLDATACSVHAVRLSTAWRSRTTPHRAIPRSAP